MVTESFLSSEVGPGSIRCISTPWQRRLVQLLWPALKIFYQGFVDMCFHLFFVGVSQQVNILGSVDDCRMPFGAERRDLRSGHECVDRTMLLVEIVSRRRTRAKWVLNMGFFSARQAAFRGQKTCWKTTGLVCLIVTGIQQPQSCWRSR